MHSVLMLYSSTDGQTLKISRKIQLILQSADHRVRLLPIGQASNVDVQAFDKIIIGASIRYGKHKKEVNDFVTANKAILAAKVSAFFSVNLVARKSDKNTPESNPYIIKFLATTRYQPDLVDVFAGKIDYQKYTMLDRAIIRFIMLITKGPINADTVVEYTSWARVDNFAKSISLLQCK